MIKEEIKKLNKDQRGNIAFVFFYIIFFVLASFMFIFFAPMAQNLTTNLFVISEDLVEDSNTTVESISDTTTKSQIQGIFQDQKDNYVFQIDLLGGLNKWAGIIILILGAIAMVLLTRTVVQRQSGGIV